MLSSMHVYCLITVYSTKKAMRNFCILRKLESNQKRKSFNRVKKRAMTDLTRNAHHMGIVPCPNHTLLASVKEQVSGRLQHYTKF